MSDEKDTPDSTVNDLAAEVVALVQAQHPQKWNEPLLVVPALWLAMQLLAGPEWSSKLLRDFYLVGQSRA